MCEGNKLQKIRETFPDRFFDVGICESHAVAFAAGHGQGRRPAGRRHLQHVPPARRSTRSSRRSRSRTSRSSSPSTAAASSAPTARRTTGRTTSPTCGSSRNMVVMAPGDEKDVAPMIDFALHRDGPTSIRYPKANLETIEREPQPIELGQAEILEWETDGMFLACGTLVGDLPPRRRAAPPRVRPPRRRRQRPVRQAARQGRRSSRRSRSAASS